MKIATVLSVSALLAMFSAVACSSPTTPASDKSNSADSKGDDDDAKDTKSTKDTKSSATNTPSSTGSTTNPGTTTAAGGDASEAACDTCLSADPTMKKVVDCQAKCSDTDDACFGKCASDNGCAENDQNSACAKQFASCQSKCEPPAPTQAEQQACATCLSGQNNAQVNAIEKCYADAKDEASATKCGNLEDSACDAKCQAAYKTCDSKCGF